MKLKMPAVRAPISMPLKIYAVKIHIGKTAIQIKFSRISCLPDFQIPFALRKTLTYVDSNADTNQYQFDVDKLIRLVQSSEAEL